MARRMNTMEMIIADPRRRSSVRRANDAWMGRGSGPLAAGLWSGRVRIVPGVDAAIVRSSSLAREVVQALDKVENQLSDNHDRHSANAKQHGQVAFFQLGGGNNCFPSRRASVAAGGQNPAAARREECRQENQLA